MKKYDVVIVGGSCAGAIAGHVLARAGKKCLIIEKAVFPREKLCGGMITERDLALLRDVYAEPVDFGPIIDSAYSTYGLYGSDLKKIMKFTHPTKKLYLVDRGVFDNFLFERAIDAGCAVVTGQKVVAVEGDAVITDSGEEIIADHIIGADGAHSAVRKYVTSRIRKTYFTLAVQVDLDYSQVNCFNDKNDIFPRIYFNVMNSGYAWIFPKKHSLSIGLGGLVHSNEKTMKDLLVSFLNKVAPSAAQRLADRVEGFPVPIHNFTKEVTRNNVYLTGDAAGFVDALTGEGIYYAMRSGQLAAQAILTPDGKSSCAYEQLVKKDIFPVLGQAYFVNRLFYSSMGLSYALRKMRRNGKYAKYYFDLLSSDMDYCDYIKTVIKDRANYPTE